MHSDINRPESLLSSLELFRDLSSNSCSLFAVIGEFLLNCLTFTAGIPRDGLNVQRLCHVDYGSMEIVR